MPNKLVKTIKRRFDEFLYVSLKQTPKARFPLKRASLNCGVDRDILRGACKNSPHTLPQKVCFCASSKQSASGHFYCLFFLNGKDGLLSSFSDEKNTKQPQGSLEEGRTDGGRGDKHKQILLSSNKLHQLSYHWGYT